MIIKHGTLLSFLAFYQVEFIQSISTNEWYGLRSVYNSTKGKNWTWESEDMYGPSWDFESQQDPCVGDGKRSWQKLTCSSSPLLCKTRSCSIIEVSLVACGLDGYIPNDISLLKSLTFLEFGENSNLFGTIPTTISLLSSLQILIIENSGIHGLVPKELNLLSSLITIDLSDNQLSGMLPSNLFNLSDTLQYFYLNGNYFTSTIPSTLGQLKLLKQLFLHQNRFTGTIPSALSTLFHLEQLTIYANLVSGTIPPSLGNLSSLLYLDVSLNLLYGPLPPQLGNLKSLEIFQCLYNMLSQSIPTSFRDLSSLVFVDMSYNFVTGSFTPLTDCTSLRSLDINSNYFNSSIPEAIGKLVFLRQLFGYSNFLSSSIPVQISLLSNLIYFSMFENRLSGSIPDVFGNLRKLYQFAADANSLTGSFPLSIASSSNLFAIYISDNVLSGTLPPSLFLNSSDIHQYLLSNNYLSGTIPHSISHWHKLEFIHLFNNVFSGYIPSSIAEMSSLQSILWQQNIFSGTLPKSWSLLGHIFEINLSRNRLTGHLSEDLFSSQYLTYLSLAQNYLNESVVIVRSNSSQYNSSDGYNGYNSTLYHLDLSLNHFTGSFENMTNISFFQLTYIDISNNMFSGFIPTYFHDAINLLFFSIANNFFIGDMSSICPSQYFIFLIDVSNNQLTGTIPSCIQNMPYLYILRLHTNRFEGNTHHIFNSSQQPRLSSIDISQNFFTGHMPSEIFRLKQLITFRAGENCFDDIVIPDTICEATNLRFLVIDGLSTQSSCQQSIWNRIQSIFITYKSIPSCLLLLPNITGVYMSGNGYMSRLHELPSASRLVNLSMSYNRIHGTIPISMQTQPFKYLDLSHNKLNGQWESHQSPPVNDSSSSLLLYSNRLSGYIPTYFDKISSLNVLRGNRFDCKARSNLPKNDPYWRETECASDEIDRCLYMALSLIMCTPAILLCWYLRECRSKFYNFNISSLYNFVSRIFATKDLPSDHQFTFILEYLRNFSLACIMLTSFICLVCIPLYPYLKLDKFLGHATHEAESAWLMSAALMSGTIPAIILLIVWLCMIVIFLYQISVIIKRMHNFHVPKIESNTENTRLSGAMNTRLSGAINSSRLSLGSINRSSSETDLNSNEVVSNHVAVVSAPGWENVAFTCCAMAMNITVMFAINGGYVYIAFSDISYEVRFVVQLAAAIMKLIWTRICYYYIRKISWLTLNQKFPLLSFILIIDNIILPCLVSMFSDPSCFYNIFIPPEPTTTYHVIPYCVKYYQVVHSRLDPFICIEAGYDVISSQFTPLFVYNFQCTSAVLTTFVPVILYSYLISFSFSLFFWINFQIFRKSVWLPDFVKHLVPPILWMDEKNIVLLQKHINKRKRYEILYENSLLATSVQHLAVLAVFGISCPYVAIIVTMSMSMMYILWKVVIEHYFDLLYNISQDSSSTESLTLWVQELDVTNRNINKISVGLISVIILCLSSVFMAIFTFDIAGDDSNFSQPYTIVIPLSFIFFGIFSSLYVVRYQKYMNEARDVDDLCRTSNCVHDKQAILPLSAKQPDSALEVNNQSKESIIELSSFNTNFIAKPV